MISLDQNTALRLRYPGFRSYKAPQAIHYRHRYCRIVLVLDTLDERVSELAPADHSTHLEDVGLDCIYRRRIGARWETIRIGRPTGKDSLTAFERRLTREQTKALPGFENARMIWSKRSTGVTLQARMAALELTAHERPTTLGKLLRAILDVDGSADELLALIADGTLQIDVCEVLSFWTTVRQRNPIHLKNGAKTRLEGAPESAHGANQQHTLRVPDRPISQKFLNPKGLESHNDSTEAANPLK